MGLLTPMQNYSKPPIAPSVALSPLQRGKNFDIKDSPNMAPFLVNLKPQTFSKQTLLVGYPPMPPAHLPPPHALNHIHIPNDTKACHTHKC